MTNRFFRLTLPILVVPVVFALLLLFGVFINFYVQHRREQLNNECPAYKTEELVEPIVELGPVTWEAKTEDLK